jgi:hypothetical protein
MPEFNEQSTLPPLADFFQTGEPLILEMLEESSSHEDDMSYVPARPLMRTNANNPYAQQPTIVTQEHSEDLTQELHDFFSGVEYDDLEEHFRAFEYGSTWISNQIFTDEFVLCALPSAIVGILTELHTVLDISRVVPADWNPEWNRNDARYSSLTIGQQDRLRELIHENPEQYRQVDDIRNRLKGIKSRTESFQIKFIAIKCLDVVQDILRNSEEF